MVREMATEGLPGGEPGEGGRERSRFTVVAVLVVLLRKDLLQAN